MSRAAGPPGPARRCVICGKPLPLGSRADRQTDTARCRKALSRREEAADVHTPIDDAATAALLEQGPTMQTSTRYEVAQPDGEDKDMVDLAGKITGPRIADGAIVTVDDPAAAQLAALRAVVAEVADELESRGWWRTGQSWPPPVRGCDDLVQRLRGAGEE